MKINNFQADTNFAGQNRRTLHVHPTALCNLACRHCYSNSSPYAAGRHIEPGALRAFLLYAYKQGFNHIAISGGEPLIYNGLGALVFASKEIGYKVSMISNGTLLKTSKAKKILPEVDYLSISIDGAPMLHNEIRNDQRAFDKILEGINIVNRYSGHYGIVHTLTARSWDSLLWFGEFARDNGAEFLQIRPLELTGRAAIEMLMLELDQITLHKVYFLINYMKNKYDDLEIKLDVLHKEFIEKNPGLVNVYPHIKSYADEPLADIIPSVVIEENGDIVPLSYGFSRQFLIGNIHSFDKKGDVFGTFMKKQGKELRNFFMQCYWKIVNDKNSDLFNTDDFLLTESLTAEVPENVA